jgi:hypothetical protein
LDDRVLPLAGDEVGCGADVRTRASQPTISPPGEVLIWLMAGFTDLRNGLSALVQSRLYGRK